MDMLEKIKADPVGEAKIAIKNPDWFDCAYEDAMVRGLLAEVDRLSALAAHWEQQRDCAAEEVEGWIALANTNGAEVKRLQAIIDNAARDK